MAGRAWSGAWRAALALLLAQAMAACSGGGSPAPLANTAPVANAGHDVVALSGVEVTLDGSGSHDADGDALTWAWTLTARPPGSSAALQWSFMANPTLLPDVVGSYSVSLTVSDGKATSAASTVTVVAIASVSRLRDAGVTACYGSGAEIACPSRGQPFFGQDATYVSNPAHFVVSNDLVADALTGLVWQRADSGSTLYNWYQAAGVQDATYNPTTIDVCGTLVVNGLAGWRLPSRRELVSIENYATGAPDRSHFQGNGTYWSSTHVGYPGAPNVWIVAGGKVNSALRFTDGLAAAYSVRCVHGPTGWGQNAFTDNGDGTVTDAMSGLRWQQADDGVARTWQDALARCEGLSLAGFDDWRLPDAAELESLVPILASDSTIPHDPLFTPSQELNGTSFYWSSTTWSPFPGGGPALGLDHLAGSIDDGGFGKTSFKFTRCVR